MYLSPAGPVPAGGTARKNRLAQGSPSLPSVYRAGSNGLLSIRPPVQPVFPAVRELASSTPSAVPPLQCHPAGFTTRLPLGEPPSTPVVQRANGQDAHSRPPTAGCRVRPTAKDNRCARVARRAGEAGRPGVNCDGWLIEGVLVPVQRGTQVPRPMALCGFGVLAQPAMQGDRA